MGAQIRINKRNVYAIKDDCNPDAERYTDCKTTIVKFWKAIPRRVCPIPLQICPRPMYIGLL